VTRAFAMQVCASQLGCFARNAVLSVSVIAAYALRPNCVALGLRRNSQRSPATCECVWFQDLNMCHSFFRRLRQTSSNVMRGELITALQLLLEFERP